MDSPTLKPIKHTRFLAKVVSLLFFVLAFPLSGKSQCAEQLISFSCSKCTVEEALTAIESKIECSFSFNASQFDLDQTITCNYSNKAVKDILGSITGKSLNVYQRGRHLVMIPLEKEEKPIEKKTYFFEGRITDSKSGQHIEKATIYDVGNKKTALSNDQGFYKIELEEGQQIGISVSKSAYYDTLIVVSPISEKTQQNILLTPRDYIEPMPLKQPSLAQSKELEMLPMVRILVSEEQSALAKNLAFLEKIPVQFSLTPKLGTNKLTSGFSENVFSINLLSGYNAGLTGLEAGGINILRQDAKGLQGAYIGNIVGGKVRGMQAAGIFNNARGSIIGIQGAGVYNLVLDTVIGLQASGVFNILRGSISGAQLSGVFNIATQNMAGVQAAGLFNITSDTVKVNQSAGGFNVAKVVIGTQLAGAMNIANDSVKGLQMAGAINLCSGNVSGTQIAGFANISADAKTQLAPINVGNKIKQVQLGFFNYSDTSALSVGFVSISKKGVHNIELAADELHYLNTSFRTGVSAFYNIFHFGFGSYIKQDIYSYGYGIGTSIQTAKPRLSWNLEATARQVSNFERKAEKVNIQTQFTPTLNIRLEAKHPSLVIAPSVNMMISSGNLIPNLADLSTPPLAYPPIFDEVDGVVEFDFWFGLKLGMRL